MSPAVATRPVGLPAPRVIEANGFTVTVTFRRPPAQLLRDVVTHMERPKLNIPAAPAADPAMKKAHR